MGHATTVLLFLLIAFVAFVAINGRLGNYLSVLWGPTEAPAPAPAPTKSSSSSGPSTGQIIQAATMLAGA
jgi:hypothetical protein